VSSTSTGNLVIGKIRSMDGPGLDRPPIDVTTMDSASDYRQFVSGGPIDGGEVSLEIIYYTSDPGMKYLVNHMEAESQKSFTLTYGSAGGTQSFTAVVAGIEQAVNLDDAITRTVRLKVTGDAGYTTLGLSNGRP